MSEARKQETGNEGVGEAELIAAGWRPVRASAFSGLVGPIYHRRDGDVRRFAFRVGPQHDNSQGRPHGGMVMTFCDEALGLSAHRARPGVSFVTIGFECQFIGAAMVGDLVEIAPHVTRATASLVFMRGDCMVGDRVIASSSGIWKATRLRPAG